MHILLIEDDKALIQFIRKAAKEDGDTLDVASDGDEGLRKAKEGSADIILLDLTLPKKDGWTVLKHLREAGLQIPVIILSARTEAQDKVRGLNAGADDYLGKPFSLDELRARIAALRRRTGVYRSHSLQVGDIKIDLLSHKVFRSDQEIPLTPREYSMLEFFVRHPGHVLSRQALAEHVWGTDFDWGSNVVDVFVNHLRNKLEVSSKPKLLHTVRGMGYRFGPETKES